MAATASKVRFIPEYPPRSPDCNAVENLFGICTQRLDKRHVEEGECNSAHDLFDRFREVAEEVAVEGFLDNITESILTRMEAIIDNDGGPTKY